MALYLLMFFEVTCLLGRRKMLRFVYVEDEKYFQKEVKTIIIQTFLKVFRSHSSFIRSEAAVMWKSKPRKERKKSTRE